jgi:hypothetical protein
LDKTDTVIVACDGRKNWRKQYIESVKKDRAEKKRKDKVNWPVIYKKFDMLLKNIDQATNWHVIQVDISKADDICAVCAKYFKDKEVIILSMDSDLEQLWDFDNVKIFSPHRNCKSYKIKPKNFDASKWLAKEVMSSGHNNLGVPQTKKEYEIKALCINLLDLPSFVEEPILEKLENLPVKGLDLAQLKSATIRKRLTKLYNGYEDKVITYEEAKEKKLKKKRKRSKK